MTAARVTQQSRSRAPLAERVELSPEERGAVAFVRGIIPDKANRERDDFYPTPPISTEALLSVERFEGEIWEPACGDGAISKLLVAHGYSVVSSDLIDRGYGTPGVDFLLDYQTTTDNIITNPPFKLAQEFVDHALARSRRKVAMLCRLAWLEGIERKKLFTRTPLARVWVHSARVPILRNGDQTDAHFATMPPALVEPCILAGCPVGGTVLDPFGGAGTTGLVADWLGRNAILIELNTDYAAMARRRIERDAPLFAEVAE